MLDRVRHMLKKEFIQVFRDPRTRFVIFGVPVIQTIVFGYAVTTDIRQVATGLYDLDNSVASRELAGRFAASGYFRIVRHVADDRAVGELMDRGEVRAVLRINHGFEEELRAGRTAQLQLLVDGTDSNTASIVLDYSSRIANEFSAQVLLARLTRAQGVFRQPGAVELASRAWFNESLRSRNFYVPGVIAMMVALVTLLLTSMAVVREKEMGTMEQIAVSPIRPAEFILGKTAPFAIVAFVDVIVVTAVAMFWFDVPMRGSALTLLAGTALFLMYTLGLGLLVSTISKTQQQAMMTTFLLFMPAVLLSGFIFPIENMPAAVRLLTCLNPLRYYLVIIRGVFLKGIGIGTLWPQMAALAGLGAASLVLASRRFHKTLS